MPRRHSQIYVLYYPEELKRASNNARAITRLHPMTVNIYAEDLSYDHAGKNAGNSGRVFSTVVKTKVSFCRGAAGIQRTSLARLPYDDKETRRRGDEKTRDGERGEKMRRDMTHLNGILLDGFTGGRSAADRRGGCGCSCSCSCSSRAAYAKVTFPETQRGRLELTQLQDQAAAA